MLNMSNLFNCSGEIEITSQKFTDTINYLYGDIKCPPSPSNSTYFPVDLLENSSAYVMIWMN